MDRIYSSLHSLPRRFLIGRKRSTWKRDRRYVRSIFILFSFLLFSHFQPQNFPDFALICVHCGTEKVKNINLSNKFIYRIILLTCIILIKITENLPDALENECSPCSEKQKEIADKVVQFLIDNKPEIWVVLEAKYDPTGAYRQHYLQNRVKEESD